MEDGACVLLQIFVNCVPDYTVSHATWVCLNIESKVRGNDDVM